MKNNLRMTPQTKAVLGCVQNYGHATNRQILIEISKYFPNLSATTVHRITLRLKENGLLANGPEIDGSMTLDSNLKPHDHFICSNCMGIKDINIDMKFRKNIQNQIGINLVGSDLTIHGGCTNCKTRHYA